LRYTAEVNGFDSLIITKLDVLDDLDEVPVCIAYEVDGARITHMPASTRRMEAIKPVYERLPGWKQSTRNASTIDQLPAAARRYLDFLEAKTGIEVGGVSIGPERNETLTVPGSKLQELLA
ncbi:MAG: adenylosuccinate synthetase, partial [Acidobacteriaceae bacterium]|nr:adenylosuccinate synthetase [Acidobacteriaceae bacterium]